MLISGRVIYLIYFRFIPYRRLSVNDIFCESCIELEPKTQMKNLSFAEEKSSVRASHVRRLWFGKRHVGPFATKP